jgi:PAS domain S-box-containing protein
MPVRAPEFSELETFVHAVEEGSIARAASRLRISAPAAAKRIRQLETLSQTPLLTRTSRGVRPTDTGAELYRAARDLLAQRARFVETLTCRSSSDPLRISGMQRVIGWIDPLHAEDAFHDTETLLAALFHATREPVLVTRADDGLVCEINDAAVQLTGYQQEEIRGRHVAELNLWDDMEPRNELVRRTVATGAPQEGELRIVDKQGGKRTVRGRFQAVELHRIVFLLLTLQVLAS